MSLFSKYRLNDFELSNRIVMAPMTRSRAIEGNVPNPLAKTYYEQRASAGLIITEATQASPDGVGYIRTPGLHSPEQIAAWKEITDAVHRKGGRIFVQLWHTGRISHPDFHEGKLPVAPSAIAPTGGTFTPQGKKSFVTPRALELSEIPAIVSSFEQAARNSRAAGFDGVEIHGANGYLIDQFLRDGANQRQDEYGGTVKKRARLALEITEAVSGAIGAERVGFRVSPHSSFNSMSDSDPLATFTYLARELDRRKLGYLHVLEGLLPVPQGSSPITPALREIFRGTYMINGGYDQKQGEHAIQSGLADLVSYGVPFIANPDLVERFKTGAPLATPDRGTFYAGDEKGYADYPALP